jgi:hypothetical protein
VDTQPQKWKHEVIEISAGAKSLRDALAQLDAQGAEVISVLPDTGGRLMSMLGSGDVWGLMIVVRRPA